ncbi:hypothetical protein FRC00_006716 [Tulasnella sp. 408]|nr:hypothetical protein FRC00_006716 [Tulasnella sp. 408]
MNSLRTRSSVSARSLSSLRQAVPKVQPCVRPNFAHRSFSAARPSWHPASTSAPLDGKSSRSWNSRLVAISTVSALVLGITLATSEPVRLESSYILGFEDDKVAESFDTIAEPASGVEFPKVITFKSPQTLPLTLLGVGIRTVSFLKMQVYAVGFYADLTRVDFQASACLCDSRHTMGLKTPEEKLEYLIRNKSVAVRIVAVRNTSFHHLRDAYIRTLNARLGVLRKENKDTLTVEQEDAVQDSLQALKSTFPPSSLPKKVPFYMVLPAPSTSPVTRLLSIPTLNGKIENTWVAEELFRNYFAGDGPSPKQAHIMSSVHSPADQPIRVHSTSGDFHPEFKENVQQGARWNQLIEEFGKQYGKSPTHIARAPGRVK